MTRLEIDFKIAHPNSHFDSENTKLNWAILKLISDGEAKNVLTNTFWSILRHRLCKVGCVLQNLDSNSFRDVKMASQIWKWFEVKDLIVFV